MAHSASAKKNVRQNETRKQWNRAVKSAVRTHIKTVLAAAESGDKAKAEAALRVASQHIDKAAKRRAMHPNTAARRKSALARRVHRMGS